MIDQMRRDKISYEVRNLNEKSSLINSIKKFYFISGLVTYIKNQATLKINDSSCKNFSTKSDRSKILIIQSKKLKVIPTNILKLKLSNHLFFIKLEKEKHNLYASLVSLLFNVNSKKSLSIVLLNGV